MASALDGQRPPALRIAPYDGLDARFFVTTFPRELEALPTPDALRTLLSLEAQAPLTRDDATRAAVRDLLRKAGYKPTGRGKPASEYLLRAASEGELRSINAAVDCCNVVSLHSGLPISVVDLDLTSGALHIDVATPEDKYVFNPSGQEIRVGGLPCLFDARGPCANAVKDAQRTKTSGKTLRTLSIVWAPRALGQRTETALAWYEELLIRCAGVVARDPA